MTPLNTFFCKAHEWARATFGPTKTITGTFNHLRSELLEIEETPHDLEEWADGLLLFMGGAYIAGHTFSDVYFAAKRKHLVNQKRTWQSNDQGFSEHVKD